MANISAEAQSCKNDTTDMNVVYFHNEISPYDFQDLGLQLRIRAKSIRHPVLQRFLHAATNNLREEVRSLPTELRSLVPPFQNILDLTDAVALRQTPLWTSTEAALLCIFQLSLFIGHHEHSSEPYIATHNKTYLTALGVGLLSAAAVAISSTLADLPDAGAHAVRIAFRLGIQSFVFLENIEPQPIDCPPKSWAYIVSGVPEATVLHELEIFHTATRTPRMSCLFISSVGHDNLIVSGPPSKLTALFRTSETLRHASFAPLPIHGGPCHAPHLYGALHVDWIMETIRPTLKNEALSPHISLISPSSGEPYVADGAIHMLKLVAAEPLIGTIHWPKVLSTVVQATRSLTTSAMCKVMSFGDSPPLHDLSKALNSRWGDDAPTTCLARWVFNDHPERQPLSIADSKIAIVGMSCQFPGGANDLSSFWELLSEGRDVHRKVPADRYDVDSHSDPTGERRNTSLTPFGCFIDEPGLFDAGFFNMSPREAAQTDPMHRLALVTAYEALEESGFVLNRTPSSNAQRVGTFYGQTCDDYREVNAGQDVDTYYIPGGCRAFAPGRINYFFKFSGPSFNCDTACSSSLATIQIACTSLLHGETDTVVAGGLNVLTNSDGFAGLSRGHFLSKTGGCKTWDASADGYCRADGIGSIVMKRLEDAEADNDNILGIILSAATNHSANAVSITHPHAPTQAELYRSIMRQAGISPLDVDYIEMHGTGTQAGDTTEMKSVTEVFSPTDRRRGRRRSNELYLGAVKGGFGHGEAAAGIMALIKTLLMFQKDAIPRHVGIKTAINPQLPHLKPLKVQIPFETVSWKKSATRKRYAVVNNFSAAGGNTSLLLEEPPLREKPMLDPRTSFVVAVSARSKKSLEQNAKALLNYVATAPSSLRVADISYTTTTRRMHHNHRIALSGSTIEEIRASLHEALPTIDGQRPVSGTPPSVAFGFSGQGTFYNAMGRQLFAIHPRFRFEITQLDDICLKHGFPSILPVIDAEVAEGYTFEPITTQLSLVCIGIAFCRLWRSLGITPSAVVGCSLGEYAAFYAAGILSAADAIYLSGSRARLMETLCTPHTHTMLAVGASFKQVQQDLDGKPCELACLNAPNSVCIAGPNTEIDEAIAVLEPLGHKCHRLNVPYAFHSAQMEPVLNQFEQLARGVTFNPPNVPVISPLLNDVVFDEKTIDASYLARATRHPVQLEDCLRTARSMDVVDDSTIWLDIGPHPIFITFAAMTLPGTRLTAATMRRDEDNWHTLASSMAKLHAHGVELNWSEWNSPFEKNLRLLDDLPAYQWNNANYWLQYNGDWMLTKDRKPENRPCSCSSGAQCIPESIPSALRTSLVHRLVEEDINENGGRLVIRSDVMQAEFLKAAGGHRMNSCAVVTSAIHADVAFTLARYMYTRAFQGRAVPGMNIKDLQYKESLIAHGDPSKHLWIQVEAVANLPANVVHLSWAKVDETGKGGPSFLSAIVEYGSNESWLDEWSPRAHLVTSRIDVLQGLAAQELAERLSRDMVYDLFAKLVDYDDAYRGMRSVTLNGLEAFADVVLTESTSTGTGGTWTVPPHHIESVVHLAGFILNGGHTLNQRENFFVTPGWKSMRFAKPLLSGGRYRSYVRMDPLIGQSGWYAGDVYILQDDAIVGLVEGITFRKFPRLLLDKLFHAPSLGNDTELTTRGGFASLPIGPNPHGQKNVAVASSAGIPVPRGATPSGNSAVIEPIGVGSEEASSSGAPSPVLITPTSAISGGREESSLVDGAMRLIAAETAMSVGELSDETEFAAIGVDSLLSLVLSQKFLTELSVEVKSALFLEYPTIGALKTWLLDYC